ncbi:MAG: hypothetical protein M5U16_05370 [Hyphomicrobium sp.]|nr:hypothetical protein [Hyphomicrobium sp.]
MPTLTTMLWAAAAFAAFLSLRLYPIWHIRVRGCDAYNILLCAEDVRRNRRLPPRIERLFILEEPEQWYPPAFFFLSALVPTRWLEQRFWLFNQLVDLANAALLFAIVTGFVGAREGALAVIVYGMVAGLVQEFAALTTRPLGLFVLNALLLAAFVATTNSVWIALAVLCGVVLIYAHKLSAQQVWFALPVIALGMAEIRWLLLLPMIYLAAFMAWPRGFNEVVRGHIAIVRFWHRNWPLLGAHAVRQSPVYGSGQEGGHFSAPLQGALVDYLKQVLHQNYFTVPALATLLLPAVNPAFQRFLVLWIVSVYAAALLIHFVKPLRGIGLGTQYVKFALLPSLLATAVAIGEGAPLWYQALAGAGLALTVRQYWLVAKLLRGETTAPGLRTEEIEPLLQRLSRDHEARILVLPYQLCDLVAYATRRPVYWGTHAQVFDERLERFFPVLRKPLSHYAQDGNLNRLLLDTRYAEPASLGLLESDVIERTRSYALLRLTARNLQARTQARGVSA